MQRVMAVPVLVAGALGLALVAVGIVYLSVECQSLPGFLGPVHGDTSPRTGLGIVAVVLGVAALVVAFVARRRRPPTPPGHP
jgi:amino acid permease